MEIKKGISQMAEYPNVEINYVMPKNGNMYYVLKDGELDNGYIIATLDPKYAIDENNPSSDVGVFSENGEILIDFNKKSIKHIEDDYVLVENAKLNTKEVMEVVAKKDDPNISSEIAEKQEVIIDKMMAAMGSQGEILFSNAYSEANIYKLDSYNDIVGVDCSFIGKNENSFFFHTNDVNSDLIIKQYKEDSKVSEDENIGLNINNNIGDFDISNDDLESVKDHSDINDEDQTFVDIENTNNLVENSNSDNSYQEPEKVEKEEIPDLTQTNTNLEDSIGKTNSTNKDEVLDNAISVIEKLISETTKLNERISELEEELKEKSQIIADSDEKKGELNSLLDKANELLEDIK